MMRSVGYDELNDLCRQIKHSFVHLETRDSYGTHLELPHLAKWQSGEPDDLGWLEWWLDVVRSHRAAGRSCRRARVVSEPLSDYQQWIMSHVSLFVDAGEDIRYAPRPRLTDVDLPGSGDFYVFDDDVVLFLHYAGNGMNDSFEISDDRRLIDRCMTAFESVWTLAEPAGEYQQA